MPNIDTPDSPGTTQNAATWFAALTQEEQFKVMMNYLNFKRVRVAVATYISSEGCSCCEGGNHPFHKGQLAELLSVPRYPDGSGFDFSSILDPADAVAQWEQE